MIKRILEKVRGWLDKKPSPPLQEQPDRLMVTTYSFWRTFLACRRKARFRYMDGLVPVRDFAAPLWFGTVIHSALECWYDTRDIQSVEDGINQAYTGMATENYDQREHQMALAMMNGYAARYPDEPFEMIQQEEETIYPIIDPESGFRNDRFAFALKVDGIAAEDDGNLIVEHKTTSQAGYDYIVRVFSDLQILLYGMYHILFGAHRPVKGVLYNVLIKTRAKTNLLERYQSPEMFQRHEIIFSQDDLDQTQRLLWDLTIELERCIESGLWHHNPTACWEYHRACVYYPICRSNMNPLIIENKYEHRVPHEEYSKLEF